MQQPAIEGILNQWWELRINIQLQLTRAELVQQGILLVGLNIVHLTFLYHDHDLHIWIPWESTQEIQVYTRQMAEKLLDRILSSIGQLNLATLPKRHNEFMVVVIFLRLLHLPKSRDWTSASTRFVPSSHKNKEDFLTKRL